MRGEFVKRTRARNVGPFQPTCSASHSLDAVERWAQSCYLLRETAALRCGRLDGLLVPVRWDAPIKAGLTALEVKQTREDFLRGLRTNQYERYQNKVNALYIVTPYHVCKTTEIPDGVGHLVVGTRRCGLPGRREMLRDMLPCVCRRHAKWREAEIDQATLWRVVFDLFDQFERKKHEEYRKRRERRDEVAERLFSQFTKLLNSNRLIHDTKENTRLGPG